MVVGHGMLVSLLQTSWKTGFSEIFYDCSNQANHFLLTRHSVTCSLSAQTLQVVLEGVGQRDTDTLTILAFVTIPSRGILCVIFI